MSVCQSSTIAPRWRIQSRAAVNIKYFFIYCFIFIFLKKNILRTQVDETTKLNTLTIARPRRHDRQTVDEGRVQPRARARSVAEREVPRPTRRLQQMLLDSMDAVLGDALCAVVVRRVHDELRADRRQIRAERLCNERAAVIDFNDARNVPLSDDRFHRVHSAVGREIDDRDRHCHSRRAERFVGLPASQ